MAVNSTGIGAANEGDIYVTDRANHRVQRFDADGEFIWAIGRDVIAAGKPGDLGDVFEKCTVAEDCKAGSFGATTDGPVGEFDDPSAIAIDQATGDLYVSDRDNRRIQQFDADGNFVRMWGFDVIVAGQPNGNGTGFEVCDMSNGNAQTDCKQGVAGNGVGQLGSSGLGTALRIAIRPSEGSPAIRKVFVADTQNRRINTYNFDGSAPASIGSSAVFGVSQPTALAVDSRGIVYASNSSNGNQVERYDSENANGGGVGFLPPITAESSTPPGPLLTGIAGTTGGLAVDPDSDGVGPDEDVLYVHRDPSASGQPTVVQQFGPLNDPGPTVAPTASDANDHMASAGLGNVTGAFDFDSASGRLFAAATNNVLGLPSGHRVYIFEHVDPPVAAMSPVTFGATSATFEGQIDATGSPTSYRFEYREAAEAEWIAVPQPDGDAGSADGFVSVGPHTVEGLEPNTEHEVRLTASKPFNGPSHTSAPVSFTTPTGPPRIVGAGTYVDHSANSAILFATIDPQSSPTAYRFEYGTDASYGQSTPLESVGSSADERVMVARIGGLTPGVTYHFNAVATNVAGTTESGDLTFTKSALPSCPNEALRSGSSAKLPDCRAYEMVSPLDKNGGDIATATVRGGIASARDTAYRQAAVGGGKVTYSSASAFAGAPGGHFSNQYLSGRGSTGWSTAPISARRGRTVLDPPVAVDPSFWEAGEFFQGFSPDLSSAWALDSNLEPLSTDALDGYVNLYRRDTSSLTDEALTDDGPSDDAPYGPTSVELDVQGFTDLGGLRFGGASADLRHQVFVANAALTPDAVVAPTAAQNKGQVYDLVDGQLHMVSVLPNGSPATTNSFPGTASLSTFYETRNASVRNAVSADGSKVFWSTTSADNGAGALYVRENPERPQSTSGCEPEKACTVLISAGPAWFWGASHDGSKALFSLGNAVDDKDLYVFDVASRTATLIAEQAWGVSAASDDLSHVYYVSREDRDGAGPAQAGENNVYDYHQESSTLVGAVPSVDVTGVQQIIGDHTDTSAGMVGRLLGGNPSPHHTQSRTTPSGRYFVFMSTSTDLADVVAGYDNTDLHTGEPDFEVYRYDAEAADPDRLSCVSCNPAGIRPRGVLLRFPYSPTDARFTAFPELRTAATIPTHEHDNYASRVVSDDGSRIFFHTEEALLPQDANGVQDLYQWQAEGTGECVVGAEGHFAGNDGCLRLISSGRSGAPSEFVDATPDGEEVFLSTAEGLDPRDPGLRDVYVAKSGGGFPLPSPVAPCEGEACQSPPPPPGFDTPASSVFSGPGDPDVSVKPRCKRGQVRRGSRCVARRASRRKCKRGSRASRRCSRRAGRLSNTQQRRTNKSRRAGK
ncbi:MAG TPA: hypothetical protein VFY04_07655 [Solirubrobacterales bacterium]|nr:hypothetical protein [Solirubrobacterales bacterium]